MELSSAIFPPARPLQRRRIGIAAVKQLAVRAADLQQRIGLGELAADGECGIAGSDVEQGHLAGAERQRGDRQRVRLKPHPWAVSMIALRPVLQRQLDRHRVVGMRQRRSERDPPGIFQRVVVRRPVADRNRQSTDHRCRLEAGNERRQIDEGLERRARLAQRIGGAVELARLIVLAADDRPDRAVRRHGDRRRLGGAIGRRFVLELLVDRRCASFCRWRRRSWCWTSITIFAGEVLLVDERACPHRPCRGTSRGCRRRPALTSWAGLRLPRYSSPWLMKPTSSIR